MKHFYIPLTLCMILVLGVSLSSAQMTETTGGNAFVPEVVSQSPLPDGNMLVHVANKGFIWNDDVDVQAGNGSMNCYGTAIVSPEGEQLSGSGSCHTVDEDGDTWSAWYTGATGGEWGFINGTGKYAGISGGGTWENDVEYADGKAANTWTGSWTIPETMEMMEMMEE